MKDTHIHFNKQPYTLETIDKMVGIAMSKGIDELWLLDHTHEFDEFKPIYDKGLIKEPWFREHYLNKKTKPIKEYIDFINEVKKHSYPIKLKFGLEVCYFEECEEELRRILSNYKFDFLLGSVHHIDGFAYDLGKEHWSGRDVDALWKRYYEIMESAIKSGLFTKISHPDALKIYGYWPSYDLKPTWVHIVKLLKQYNVGTEDNYGFLRYGFNNYGLDKTFLDILNKEGIEINKSSDAHRWDDIGTFAY